MLTAIGIILLGVGAFSLGVWTVYAYTALFATVWVDDRDETDEAGA